jgi:hypothetical protein
MSVFGGKISPKKTTKMVLLQLSGIILNNIIINPKRYAAIKPIAASKVQTELKNVIKIYKTALLKKT